jgi:hypothetical protein
MVSGIFIDFQLFLFLAKIIPVNIYMFKICVYFMQFEKNTNEMNTSMHFIHVNWILLNYIQVG